MKTILKIAVGLTLGALLADPESSLSQENSPKEVVGRFCQRDAEGKRLKSEDQKEILALFYEQKSFDGASGDCRCREFCGARSGHSW